MFFSLDRYDRHQLTGKKVAVREMATEGSLTEDSRGSKGLWRSTATASFASFATFCSRKNQTIRPSLLPGPPLLGKEVHLTVAQQVVVLEQPDHLQQIRLLIIPVGGDM
jgi:hypothetical protein